MAEPEQRRGDYMRTYTQERFYPLDPRPEEITIEDISHHLALMCRFGGATKTFYSVAQHSVLVSGLCPLEYALWGLLHDAPEAFLGDCVRPLKRQPEMRCYVDAEERLMRAIGARFGLGPCEGGMFGMPEPVHRADEILLATEARDLLDCPDLQTWSLRQAPLPVRLTPWTSRQAESRFLTRFRKLTG
jgi:hypothetical protein